MQKRPVVAIGHGSDTVLFALIVGLTVIGLLFGVSVGELYLSSESTNLRALPSVPMRAIVVPNPAPR